MAVMDEFKEEREALKHGTPKQKFAYFMDYYKWYVIAAVIAVILVSYTIYEIATRKETVFYTCLLNTLDMGAEEYNAGFEEAVGLDTEEYRMLFDSGTWIDPYSMDETTMANSQKLMAHLAAGELDTMITDMESITNYAYQDNFLTMEEFLTPEQYEKYQPYFYYIDAKAMEEWNNFISDPDNLMLDISFEFPDPRKPEEMEEPVAMGIFLDECEKLKECYHFRSDDVVFGVFGNTSHKETALQYLEYLMQ